MRIASGVGRLAAPVFALLVGAVACGGSDDGEPIPPASGGADSGSAAAGGTAAGGSGGTSASAGAGGTAGLAGAAGAAGAAAAAGSGGAADGGSPDASGASDSGTTDSSTSDASAPACCLAKPPGNIPTNGGWNDCPYSGSGRQHAAIDFSSPKGTPIPAGMDGVVQFVRNNGDPKCYDPVKQTCSDACLKSGDFIMLKAACGDPLQPNNDFYVRYHHISGVKSGIKVGSKVQKGDIIAYVGDSGCATGPHVHLATATFKKGSYSVGQNPVFYDCKYLVNPSTRFCKNVP